MFRPSAKKQYCFTSLEGAPTFHPDEPHQGTGNNVISADFRRTSKGPVKPEKRHGGFYGVNRLDQQQRIAAH